MIEVDISQHLITEVPSVEGRVFANVIAQDTVKPVIVYTIVGEYVSGSCQSDSNYREWDVTLYTEGYEEGKIIKNEVIAALKSCSHNVKGIVVEDAFETQAELFSQIITFHTGKRK